ncbi:hypothetical protein ASH00_02365 [Arthrobacter sp. Soil782]|uniref:hypothetical protein n=1 Tax=Arthrobacter sp. Soil782 TaxID=1736410 RepID=UPI0006F324BF|nr:hypothetical protein [Arthrobacter sp. Soil782]KRF08572.1 hypothetical protein ASH00_02365 [Arthrobacter sp. Soil782]
MTQDQSSAGEAREQENGGQEGNPFGGSPTFPDPSNTRPTGSTTGFNGAYGETEHHTQNEYDAEHQQKNPEADPGNDSGTSDSRNSDFRKED